MEKIGKYDKATNKNKKVTKIGMKGMTYFGFDALSHALFLPSIYINWVDIFFPPPTY